MEQERVKATHKIKKVTLGGFYSDFTRLDPRGKSTKEVRLMLEDARKCVVHQLTRIKKLKYVIIKLKEEINARVEYSKLTALREEKNRKLTNVKNKVKVRDTIIDKKEQEILNLENKLKILGRENAKLHREVEKMEDKISEVRNRKRRIVVKEVEAPLPLEVKRLKRIAEKSVADRLLNYTDLVALTTKFCRKQKITDKQLTTLLQAETEGSVKTQTLLVADSGICATLENKGYFSYQLVDGKNIWFLTTKGKDLVKDYKNYMSYGNNQNSKK